MRVRKLVSVRVVVTDEEVMEVLVTVVVGVGHKLQRL